MLSRQPCRWSLLLAFSLLIPSPGDAKDRDTRRIEGLVAQLDEIVHAPISARRDRQLKRFFLSHFDYRDFESRVLQDSRKQFSAKQRQAFSRAFKEALVSRLVLKINDEKRTVEGSQCTVTSGSRTGEVVVSYRTEKDQHDIVLHLGGPPGARRIADLTVSGALLSRSYRATVNKIVRRDGVDALIARLEKRTAGAGLL